MSEIFSTGRETTNKRINKQTDLTHEKDVLQGAMRKETNDNAVWDICLYQCPWVPNLQSFHGNGNGSNSRKKYIKQINKQKLPFYYHFM